MEESGESEMMTSDHSQVRRCQDGDHTLDG
jgi:hypothetical protein